jgi:hypothetical protein
VVEDKTLTKVAGAMADKISGPWRKSHHGEFTYLYASVI